MTQEQQSPIVDENHIIAERREKLANLRKAGVAFPNDFVPRTTLLTYMRTMVKSAKNT